MRRVAAIDCGTNSIRLLIADGRRLEPAGGGRLRDVHREMRIVRLGQGVDATGQFAPEAIERTKAALTDYAELLRRHDVSKVRMVATSATRDAANRDVFFAMTSDVLGAVVPGAVAEVITGDEEAELSFHGAVDELDIAAAPFVVVDLGGGSTEVVLGEREMQAGYSADIGCVRLTERCLHTDPPTAVEVAAAREVVRETSGGGAAGGTRRAGADLGRRRGNHDHPCGACSTDDDLRPGGDPPVPRRVRRIAAGVRRHHRHDA